MNADEALAEAKRHWGPDAMIHLAMNASPTAPKKKLDAVLDDYVAPVKEGGKPKRWLVGVQYGAFFDVKGIGKSWETAFGDADRRVQCESL